MTTLTNLYPLPFRVSPLNNITPFTYRDGTSFMELLESMRVYINDDYRPAFDAELNRIIAEFNEGIENAENHLTVTKEQWDAAHATFMANFDAEILAINLNAIKEIIKNSFSTVSIKDFGGVVDGIADDTAAINAAIAAVGVGGTVNFPGGNCAIYGAVNPTNKSVRLVGHGTTLISMSHQPMVTFTGSWGTAYPVSSYSTGTVTTNAEVRYVVNLIVPGLLPYKVGDVVKVYSDDIVTGGRPGSNGVESRVGQNVTVYSVSPGILTVLVKDFIDPMTTNVKVSKLNDIGAALIDFTIDVKPELLVDGGKSNTIVFTDILRPIIRNVKFKNTTAQALQINGCYGAVGENVEFNNSIDNSANNQYGYGILDNSSSHGFFSNIRANFVRHLYSDDSPRIAVNSSPSLYGRTFSNHIVNSVGFGNSSATFDTHACSQNVSFINCEGHGSGGPVFNLRGRGHTVRGGKCGVDRDWGVYIFAEGGTNTESHSHLVENIVIESPVVPVLVAVNKVSLVRETRKTRFKNVSIIKPNDLAMHFVNATVDLSNVTIDDIQMTTGGAANIKLDNSKVTIQSLEQNYKAGLANNAPIGIQLLNASDLKIFMGDVEINGTTNGTRFANYIVSGAPFDVNGYSTSVFRIKKMEFNANVGALCDWGVAAVDSYIDYSMPLGNALGKSSTYIPFDGVTWYSTGQHALSRTTSPYVILDAVLIGAFTLTNIRGGRYLGQTITFVNRSAFPLTINNEGTIKTQSGAAVTLAANANGSARFTWVNGFWVQV